MPVSKKDALIIKCEKVKLKFISTKGNDFGENSFFNVLDKDKLNEILSVKRHFDSENEIAELRNEPLSKQHFPFFMDAEKTDIILKVNHKKVSCKNELEKDKVYNATIEFTHYDFENKETKENIKGWSCSVKF